MDRAHSLIERHFGSQHGELLVGQCKVRDLAEAYRTPCFVYDGSIAEKKWAQLRKALPARFEIFYSIKANPNPAFLQLFLSKGCGLEVASAGEFYQAMKAGCSPEKILFAGPGKTNDELEFAISKNIGEIHAESLTEIGRISAIAARLSRRVPVAVRINPSSEAQGGAMRMGGKPTAFGIDEEQMDEAVGRIATDPNLDFHGVHIFSGTQILDQATLITQYQHGIEIARRAAARANCGVATLDFGGGLGVPYFENERELDVEPLLPNLEQLLHSMAAEECFRKTRFLVEPGRFLTAECGIYLTRITDIKISHGKKFLITDGGMHHHLAASGNLGQTIKRNFPVAILNKLDSPLTESVDVVGPLCTPLDVLARNVLLPSAEIGDLVGILQSGAYARTASPLGFLGHPTPPEIWVDGAHHQLVRQRGELSDLLRDVCTLDMETKAR